MTRQGPGKLFLERTFFNRGAQYVDVTVDLYNFDIDIGTLKDEHRRFLADKLIPTLKASPLATVKLIGSASRSGPESRNKPLSETRAKEAQKLLADVGGQIKKVDWTGEPTGPGPQEDERDRSVRLILNFPVRISSADLWSDDWKRKLEKEEIVGLDGGVSASNVQLEYQGMPRPWDWGIVEDSTLVLALSKLQFTATLGKARYDVTLEPAGPNDQPGNLSRTFYRKSLYAFDLKPVPDGRQGVATVSFGPVPVSLDLHQWRSHGQGGDGNDDLDPLRLLKAAGAERVELLMSPTNLEWLVRSPAFLIFYAGNGNRNGCLSRAAECWVSPTDLLAAWKNLDKMRVLIVAAPVLGMENRVAFFAGGPGKEWAKFLQAKDPASSFHVILGYRDKSPQAQKAREEIAKKMGWKIAAGMKNADDWVQAWLGINRDHADANARNAVAMTAKGYWWVDEQGMFSVWPDKLAIHGPLPIVV